MALICYRGNNMSRGHSQLTRSLERILEEAQISGELKLTNRKLKEFPRNASKFNLSDTVTADLSRNRFCELPEEITNFVFLETLLLYHNTIRTVPQTVKGLTSLTYLDLRNNQLISLPREICFLPLQVLLVAHNRLTNLPDELGRMEQLTDLDVSCNQIGNLPPRIGDLKSLRSFCLRSNQLVYLPRELTFLSLVSLDISNNRISTLPNEIRQMTSLVSLKLENNPLTSPPASLCIRGLVHILKFLETQAFKDERKTGCTADGFATLRRTPRNLSNTIDDNKIRRYHVDSGYCTSDGVDKRWSQDTTNANVKNGNFSLKSPPSNNILSDSESSTVVNTNNKWPVNSSNSVDIVKDSDIIDSNNSLCVDDDVIDCQKIDVKNKDFCNIQTYREYKEALRQQRNQETISVYRTKSQQRVLNEATSDTNNLLIVQELANTDDSSRLNGIQHDCQSKKESLDDTAVPLKNVSIFEENTCQTKKPIQKVTPSRNLKLKKTEEPKVESDIECSEYIKPSSPFKCNGVSLSNQCLITNKAETIVKAAKLKLSRSPLWNAENSSEKLSFTMRREFDKQKEETELISQLRNIIETRLKMNLPDDLASALTDGVILCHLANYVRPRSVASIHVPSPGVAKLTMARCRRNVDNFLEACRKIGVDEESICSCADVVSNEETLGECVPNPRALYRTISALFGISHRQQHQQIDQVISATNSNKNGNQDIELQGKPPIHKRTASLSCPFVDNNEVKLPEGSNDISLSRNLCDVALYAQKENSIKIINSKNICCCTEQAHVKFDKTNDSIHLEKSGKTIENEILQKNEVMKVNDLNTTKCYKLSNFQNSRNININEEQNSPKKIVTKRIEFFESNATNKVTSDSKIFSIYNPTLKQEEKPSSNYDSIILTVFLSSVFVLTFFLLIIFPLPN